MSLGGNLQDLGLTDIFQIINMSHKSGVLRIDQGAGMRGRVIFIEGKIVGAWVPRAAEILADIMSEERLTMPGVLTRIQGDRVDPIAAVKEAFGPQVMDEKRSRMILEKLTRATLMDLMRWSSGSFLFELRGNHPGDPELPASWLLIPEGIDPNLIGLEAARLSDEAGADRTTGGEDEEKSSSPYEETLFDLAQELREEFESSEDMPQRPLSPGLSLLKAMLFELNRPNVHTYITLLILRYASSLMNRAILFKVVEETFVGLGEFGLSADKEESAKLVREIHLSRKEASILATADKGVFAKKISPDMDEASNRHLFDRLGGEVPREVFVGPIICNDRLVGVLYGDNLPENTPIGDTESLEIFLSQAGIAMERAMGGGSGAEI